MSNEQENEPTTIGVKRDTLTLAHAAKALEHPSQPPTDVIVREALTNHIRRKLAR